MRAAGLVVTRERLEGTLRQRETFALDRSLDVHVAHLRNKVGRSSPIRTVRGEGYFFACEPLE
jgi:DNA-binding response OmpR family regulator